MPRNPGSYSLSEIPPAPGAGSRFYIAKTTAGWNVEPSTQLGDSAAGLALALKSQQPKVAPPSIQVPLKLAVKEDGEWVLRDRGEASGVPSYESTRPGKIGQTGDLAAGSLLDSFLLGELGWEKATDAQVWEALRATCEAHDLSGQGWRTLNDAVATAICARAGVEVTAYDLPHPYPAAGVKSGVSRSAI